MGGITYPQLLFIVQGAGWTLVLSLLGFVGGAVIGLPADLKAWLDQWVTANIANGKLNTLYEKHFGIPLPAEYQATK